MDFFFTTFYMMPKGSKKQCCTDQLLSDLWATIEIPCYFRPKSRGSKFGQNNMGCQW